MELGRYASEKIGQALLADGRMTVSQVDRVLESQCQGDPRKFGEIATYYHFLTSEQLENYLLLRTIAKDVEQTH